VSSKPYNSTAVLFSHLSVQLVTTSRLAVSHRRAAHTTMVGVGSKTTVV